MLVLEKLARLAVDESVDDEVRGVALAALDRIQQMTGRTARVSSTMLAHYRLARLKIERALEDPASVADWPVVAPPPGSPIGSAGALLDATR